VIVIGAGLGGLTLAQGLRRAGIDVAVYERDGERGRPQGISLHLDDRGRSALRACLPPESSAMAEATMGGPREQALRLSADNGELAVVGSLPLDGQQGRTRAGRQASRPLLRAVLLSGLEDAVTFGAEFSRFEQQSNGTIRAWFTDGRTDTADVLVGADGIGSAVRRQYLPQVKLVDTGKRMVMGATPLQAVAATGLSDLVGHSPSSVQVDGKMAMALGVLRFAQPPVAARDQWLPSLRAPAVADAEDYVMWAIPTTEERAPAERSPAEVWRVAQQLVAGMPATLRVLIDHAWPGFTVPLRIAVIPPMAPWPVSSVTVIGDAIHVAPGFGGNLAMQDAHRLCEALAQAAGGEQELPSAIGAYEEAMRRENFPERDADAQGAAQPVGSR
jgi:2-polyprenyl-6-methoxyphenol hydroxylase-like FAD-dependent oxidoreductase